MNFIDRKKHADNMFKHLKKQDIVRSAVYETILSSEYDATIGEEVTNTSSMTVDVFLTSYKRRELTNDVKSTDIKCITTSILDPNIDDTLLVDGTIYRVVDYVNNKWEPTITLQLRGSDE